MFLFFLPKKVIAILILKVISIKRLILKYWAGNRHFLSQILLCTKALLENGPKLRDNFITQLKIYISRSFLMQFCATKNLDKLSVNIMQDYHTGNID